MASYNKFNTFVGDLCSKVHNLNGTEDMLKVYLSNTTPDASNHSVKADLAETTNENGYDEPQDVQNSGSTSGGTFTLEGTSLTITADGGSVGPFQYVTLYNDTPTDPEDPLISWWDYGSEVTLNDGETFTIKFSDADVDSAGTIFTLS